jgi:1,4-alpha-glucan branching enzyme
MKTKVTFTLPAEAVEGASEVVLLGDFNNWNPEEAPKLKKQKDGSFKTTAQLEAGQTYQYRFLLDDGRWVNDYHAQSYASVPGYYIDNCIITVPEPAKENIAKKKTAKPDTSTKKKTAAKSSKKTSAKETTKVAKAKSADEKKPAKKTKKVEVKNLTEKEKE